MKFFTRDWFHDDDRAVTVPLKYRKHLRRLSRLLPPALRRFSREFNVHDGLFRKVVLDDRRNRIVMKLRCGDLQVGYFDADLVFDGAMLDPADRKQLRLVANRKKTEILWDEVDVADGGRAFEYRFICWPTGEASIRFQGFSYTTTPRRSRHFVGANPRFRVLR